MNRNKTVKWLKNSMENKIEVDDEILNFKSKIRGIYGIFSFDEITQKETCLYVGKSVNIYSRMFKKSGHLEKIKNGVYMFNTFKECIDDDAKKLRIKVLEKVPYQCDDFNRDAQRLAFAEYTIIEEFQRKNQCLDQLPEGVNKKREIKMWNKIKAQKQE